MARMQHSSPVLGETPSAVAAANNGLSSNWQKLKQSFVRKEKVVSASLQNRGIIRRNKGNRKQRGPKTKTDGANAKGQKRVRFEDVVDEASEGPSVQQQHGQQLKLTKVMAMDCEYVGVGDDGADNMVARVSLVNSYGDCVYDKYVKPTEPVVDYRTACSGIREEDIISGIDFSVVQKEVSDILEGRILVGHSIHNDLKVLYLSHPKRAIRDTAKYKLFRTIARTRYPSLKKLCRLVLGIRIQEGEHDSVCDARAALHLYQLHKRNWETGLRCPRKAVVEKRTGNAGVVGEMKSPAANHKQRRIEIQRRRRDRHEEKRRRFAESRTVVADTSTGSSGKR